MVCALLVIQRRMAVFFVGEQFVEHQAVGLFALAPEDHQHDDLQFIERNWRFIHRTGTLNDDFALNGVDDVR